MNAVAPVFSLKCMLPICLLCRRPLGCITVLLELSSKQGVVLVALARALAARALALLLVQAWPWPWPVARLARALLEPWLLHAAP